MTLRSWAAAIGVSAWLFSAAMARAGELDAFTGRLKFNTSAPTTYTWGIEYREPLADQWDASFVWLNEGHRPHDHRDGQALQLWWHTLPKTQGWVFDVGVGPYRYYDTRILSSDPDFQNKHGWGGLASVAADYYFANHWFAFLRLNQVDAANKYDSTSLAAGLGYRFNRLGMDTGDAASDPSLEWEILTLLGERIGNTAHSESGLAESLEVRRELSAHFAASATYLVGQGTRLHWRDGFALQLWLEQHLTDSFTVGVGAGGFLVSADDSLQDASSPSNLAAMVSVTMAYAFARHWQARVVWDRIGTGDDHDADIVLFGMGHRF